MLFRSAYAAHAYLTKAGFVFSPPYHGWVHPVTGRLAEIVDVGTGPVSISFCSLD